MLLDWSDAAEAQLAGAVVRPAVLFRIGTPDVIRLWAGVMNLEVPTDLIEDVDMAVYRGAGELLNLPTLNQLINGVADRADFTLSGAAVTGEVAALASAEAPSIRGAVVNLGLRVLDVDWQPISPTAWVWDGLADSLIVNRAATKDGQSRTLTLSVGGAMTGRRRPSASFWTDPDQKRSHPTDRAFEHVRQMSRGTTKVWG